MAALNRQMAQNKGTTKTMIEQRHQACLGKPGHVQEEGGSSMTQHTSDSQEQPKPQMSDTQDEIEQGTLNHVLITESFRQYLEQQIAMRQRGATSVIGVTLNYPERAPGPLRAQWKHENAIARYLAQCFPERRVHVDYDQVQFGSLDEEGTENSISLDTPALYWVTLFLQASDAQAAGYDHCMSSITAVQGWALLEVVEDIVTRFVSQ